MKNLVEDFVLRMTGGKAEVAALCAKTTGALEEGDVCVRLTAEEVTRLAAERGLVACVTAEAEAETVKTPFVIEERLLYTRRNWVYEKMVRRAIGELAAKGSKEAVELPRDGFYGGLRAEQRAAVATMCQERFSILTGGPGTGKTFTIARAVKFIRDRSESFRLGLAAPTGKAAARLMESMQKAMDDVPKATTLHQLLGANPALGTFKYNRANPLPLDWLIVDEASMIGLPMMARILAALPEGCRLTLVGDVDQLASVERGHVLGDLCQMANVKLCRLAESTRFPVGGAIANLAAAVNENRPREALALLKSGDARVAYTDITGADPFHPRRWPGFVDLVEREFAAFAASRTPEEALRHLNDFRILCALRNGPYGVERVNRFVASLLGARAPVPVMITRNDRTLDVANGDVGVVMPDAPRDLHLPAGDRVRAIRTELLPNVETSFATTVHKSQGSEYADVAIVMPPEEENPLLTREILYTGITRTVKRVFLYAGEATIRRCCGRKVERVSGLVKKT